MKDSVWSWWIATDIDDSPALNRSSKKDCPTCGHPRAPYFREIAAFTVAELGEMLQEGMTDSHKTAFGPWICKYVPLADDGIDQHIELKAYTEADARAKMLIYLLENKLIKLSSQQ